MKNKLSFVIILFFLYLLVFPRNAYAYLDPGTGSLIIQVIISAVLGVSVAIKIFWRKISNFFVARFSKKKEDEKKDDNQEKL